jgi:hypothetical protein
MDLPYELDKQQRLQNSISTTNGRMVCQFSLPSRRRFQYDKRIQQGQHPTKLLFHKSYRSVPFSRCTQCHSMSFQSILKGRRKILARRVVTRKRGPWASKFIPYQLVESNTAGCHAEMLARQETQPHSRVNWPRRLPVP